MLARRCLARVVSVVALVALAGCSGGGGSGVHATVSGNVTHNGAPVSGAKVTFFSTVESGGKGGASYSATTDSNGKYLIATVGKEPGIPPGLYKITVVRLENQKSNLPADFDAGQMEASGMGKNSLPKDYENPTTTKLSTTLEAGKNENVNFDLKGLASKSTGGATTGGAGAVP